MKNKKGFTLVEVLLVVVIISILAAIVIVAINPARQIAQANNTQRSTDVKTILDAVHQYGIDQRGTLPTEITTQETLIGDGVGEINICSYITPTYVASMPYDPTAANAHAATTPPCTGYETGYTIVRTEPAGRITIKAPGAELEQVIGVTR
jgi:type IV pilus assembly protein PilA